MNEQYTLPEDWKWVKLGEVIRETLPGFACGKRSTTGGVIQLRMNNISSTGRLDLSSLLKVPATEKQVEKYRLFPGDTLFNNTNSVELVGKTTLFNEERGIFVYSNHLTRLRPIAELLDHCYLAYWLQLQWHQRVFEMSCNRWIGQAAVQREKLLEFIIPLSPIIEQRRIAAKIQELMEEISNLKSAISNQYDASQTLPSAYLRQVFESDEAKKWERKRLGEVLEVIESGSRPKGGVHGIKEGIPSVGAEHLNSFSGFNFNNIRYIPKEFYKNMTRGKIKKRDVLVVKDGATTGKVSFVGNNFPFEESAVNEHVFILRAKEFLIQEFLFLFLYSPLGQTQIQQEFHGAAQGGINQQFVNGVEISFPKLEQQETIVNKIKEKMSQAENLQSAIRNQQLTINALPQAILRKAFRGEL